MHFSLSKYCVHRVSEDPIGSASFLWLLHSMRDLSLSVDGSARWAAGRRDGEISVDRRDLTRDKERLPNYTLMQAGSVTTRNPRTSPLRSCHDRHSVLTSTSLLMNHTDNTGHAISQPMTAYSLCVGACQRLSTHLKALSCRWYLRSEPVVTLGQTRSDWGKRKREESIGKVLFFSFLLLFPWDKTCPAIVTAIMFKN